MREGVRKKTRSTSVACHRTRTNFMRPAETSRKRRRRAVTAVTGQRRHLTAIAPCVTSALHATSALRTATARRANGGPMGSTASQMPPPGPRGISPHQTTRKPKRMWATSCTTSLSVTVRYRSASQLQPDGSRVLVSAMSQPARRAPCTSQTRNKAAGLLSLRRLRSLAAVSGHLTKRPICGSMCYNAPLRVLCLR